MSGAASDPTALPKYDFPNQGTLAGLLEELRTSILKNTDDMLPATIVAYNRTTNMAAVQPSIYMVTTDNTLVSRGQVASVPVLALGGGGFLINFPLVAGSRGWIKANDRDISLYLQSSMQAGPNSKRFHSFSDGLFIPDVVSGFTIAGGDANNMVIQNLAGTVKITLSTNTINIAAPTVNVNSTTTNLNGTLNINGTPFLHYKATGVQSGTEEGSGLSAT